MPPTLRRYAASEPRRRATFVLAHGAGAGHDSAFIVALASALAERGLDVCTFNFPYIDKGRRLPDAREVLETCLRDAVTAATALPALDANRMFIGGKSMGGRIASHLAADQAFVSARAVKGLICLGYPLHPPGKPQQLRTAHLPHLQVPTLIVQGTRDAFGSPAELQPYIAGTAVPVTVHVVEGGDHSFTVRKKDGGDPARVLPDIADTVASWVASVG